MKDMVTRRGFVGGLAAAGIVGCRSGGDAYSVALLGDTHYDAEPEGVYHSHYDESNRWAKVQHAEFARNGEMWRERCPRLVAASGALARRDGAKFVLQLGDLVQGDCDDPATHVKMLDDCLKALRGHYPAGLPFLTVIGNHDFRGKGARAAYLDFARRFVSGETARLAGSAVSAEYPAFSFRVGPDLWVFCDFETGNLDPISDLIDADPGARRVFLVTHGPFTTCCRTRSFRWRLGGSVDCDASRPRLYETLSRRHAVVLSGHTHTTTYYRHENRFGSFSECTVNSVWAREDLATAEPLDSKASDYNAKFDNLSPEQREQYARDIALFKPGLREYFHNRGAGHYRLDISDAAVSISFYPGDALERAVVFAL